MVEYVYIWAQTLEGAKKKAKWVGLIKIESGRLHSKGSLENTYQFEKLYSDEELAKLRKDTRTMFERRYR